VAPERIGVVTPHAGVWIEMWMIFYKNTLWKSHPTRVCGLKLFFWHEESCQTESHPTRVCGLKFLRVGPFADVVVSHPTRVCGLKYARLRTLMLRGSHTPRGCVD